MSSAARNLDEFSQEPAVRTITREVPNLRNLTVAEDYRRQRSIITVAAEHQTQETEFWESVQSHEGWV